MDGWEALGAMAGVGGAGFAAADYMFRRRKETRDEIKVERAEEMDDDSQLRGDMREYIKLVQESEGRQRELVQRLEERVDALERTLGAYRQKIARLVDMVRRLAGVLVDNDLPVPDDVKRELEEP